MTTMGLANSLAHCGACLTGWSRLLLDFHHGADLLVAALQVVRRHRVLFHAGNQLRLLRVSPLGSATARYDPGHGRLLSESTSRSSRLRLLLTVGPRDCNVLAL